MQVDHVLILAAGKGTRMGNIGKEIPKVLWPVFTKSILELEILYAQKYVKGNIFINVFNYQDKIVRHIDKIKNASDNQVDYEKYEKVKIVREKEVLDIGGAIHNLAQKLGYKGKLLILNSDQFIMLDSSHWQRFYTLSQQNDSVILTHNVQKNDLYNATIVENNKLVEIRPNNQLTSETPYETYTGMSIINLESLKPFKGASKFFDTVADFEELEVGVLNIENNKYWDFGTLKRYYQSMFDIIKNWHQDKDEPFINFLKANHVLRSDLLGEYSYNSQQSHVIDLYHHKNKSQHFKHVPNTIYLGHCNSIVPEHDCIVFDETIDLVD